MDDEISKIKLNGLSNGYVPDNCVKRGNDFMGKWRFVLLNINFEIKTLLH